MAGEEEDKAKWMEEWQRNREASTGQHPLVRSGMSQDGVGRGSGGEETLQRSVVLQRRRETPACEAGWTCHRHLTGRFSPFPCHWILSRF